MIRIACTELESWYLGDLASVGETYNMHNLYRKQNTRKYRNPDNLMHPDLELEELTKHQYQKIEGSRKLGSVIRIGDNKSRSFKVFYLGLNNLLNM